MYSYLSNHLVSALHGANKKKTIRHMHPCNQNLYDFSAVKQLITKFVYFVKKQVR